MCISGGGGEEGEGVGQEDTLRPVALKKKKSFQGFSFLSQYQDSSSPKSLFLSCHECVVRLSCTCLSMITRNMVGKIFLRSCRWNKRVYTLKHIRCLFKSHHLHILGSSEHHVFSPHCPSSPWFPHLQGLHQRFFFVVENM